MGTIASDIFQKNKVIFDSGSLPLVLKVLKAALQQMEFPHPYPTPNTEGSQVRYRRMGGQGRVGHWLLSKLLLTRELRPLRILPHSWMTLKPSIQLELLKRE